MGVYEQVRRDAFDEDIGQNSWLTATEQDAFGQWLNLSPGQALLDVACGSGGPALRIAAMTGVSVIGVDVHERAIATGNALAAERGLAHAAEFRVAAAAEPLPFSDGTFDAITCIDAINHLPDRRRVIAEWARLLKPAGRLLFTDPIIVNGPSPMRKSRCAAPRASIFSFPRDMTNSYSFSAACASCPRKT